MPLTIPAIDNRNYRDLVDEALARIPVHNPEWTNFNDSDPGVTLLHLFAFLTDTLLYRANRIPERSRLKFLRLLGIPLQAASAARGVVTVSNDRGPLETITLPAETSSPEDAFTPSRLLLLSRPLRDEPMPFLCAICVS